MPSRISALLLIALTASPAATAASATSAVEVRLRAPLATLVPALSAPVGGKLLRAEVEIPNDAPADLGVGAYVADRDGHWFQCIRPGGLAPGRQVVEFALDGSAPLVSEPGHESWQPEDAAVEERAGLFFYSASTTGARLRVAHLSVTAAPIAPPPARRLLEVALDGMSDGAAHATVGERWSLSLLPQPFPGNPYDADDFAIDAVFTAPDGSARRIPGFFLQPMSAHDRGDRQQITPAGAGRFAVRLRPDQPGRWHARLEARWRGGAVHCPLPDVVVAGMRRDDIARVDSGDQHFFTVGGAFWWPIGLNLNNPYDTRCRDVCGTRLTPDRGSLVYDAILARLAAAGGDACEIWMSSWNVGLEWRADWPGFAGRGRYNQGNAWKLDQILDRAWALGIRVNLVINNHGQASANADREWKDNPWNSALGGPLDKPIDVFQDPAALAGQERLRRYLVARYADHPAIMGWKLWSEVDLTAARGEVAWRWHEQAAARWDALDTYRHPITSHWAGDFRRVNPAVAVLPGIDYLCIDAYRHANQNGAWRLLADILADSAVYPGRGLAMYNKPVLTTEFGAGSGAAPESFRLVDHLTGAWAGLISGHAGAPMLWWWEWVDQTDRWQPYGAIRRFVAGEDLRGGRSAALDAQPQDLLWSRAWVKPGRLLGYLLDRRWGADGKERGSIDDALIIVGDDIAPGTLRVEWWDADRGEVTARSEIAHPGGSLLLAPPSFARHLAFKIARADGAPAAEPALSAPAPAAEGSP